jgi:hypothetical protein
MKRAKDAWKGLKKNSNIRSVGAIFSPKSLKK